MAEDAVMAGDQKGRLFLTIQHSYGSWRTRRTKSHVDMTEQTASRSFSFGIFAVSFRHSRRLLAGIQSTDRPKPWNIHPSPHKPQPFLRASTTEGYRLQEAVRNPTRAGFPMSVLWVTACARTTNEEAGSPQRS
jgi:hypothetical protein